MNRPRMRELLDGSCTRQFRPPATNHRAVKKYIQLPLQNNEKPARAVQRVTDPLNVCSGGSSDRAGHGLDEPRPSCVVDCASTAHFLLLAILNAVD